MCQIFFILPTFSSTWWILKFISKDVAFSFIFSYCRPEQCGAGCHWLRPPCLPGAKPLPSLQISPLRDGRALQPVVHPAQLLHKATCHLPLSQVAPLRHRAHIRHNPARPVPGIDPAIVAGWLHQCIDKSYDIIFVLRQLGSYFVLCGAAARELQ